MGNPLITEQDLGGNGAVLSACGRYRYRLWRHLGAGVGTVLWVLLNPSTADHRDDDPTVRRLIGFSRRWGYSRLKLVNLFGWRATDPTELGRVDDPVGPDNDAVAQQVLGTASVVVVGWGAHAERYLDRVDVVDALVRAGRAPVRCLGRTLRGHPKHPLYLRESTELVP